MQTYTPPLKDMRSREEKSDDAKYKTMVYYERDARQKIDTLVREEFGDRKPSYNRIFNIALEYYLRAVENAGGVDKRLLPLEK